MEKVIAPNQEKPKPFAEQAAAAIEKQAAELKAEAKTPLQRVVAETIRLGSEDAAGKHE